jgi:hypothetical protein
MSNSPNKLEVEFRVQVRAVGADEAEGPPAVRLRKWLKIGLRAFNLRCISAVQVNDKDKPEADGKG